MQERGRVKHPVVISHQRRRWLHCLGCGVMLFGAVSCTVHRVRIELSGPSGVHAWGQSRRDPANTAFVPGPARVPDTLLWEAKTNGEVRAEPAADRGVIVASGWDRRLYIFNARTGRRVWRQEFKAPPTGVVFVGDSLAFTLNDQRSRFLLCDLRTQRELVSRPLPRTAVPPLRLPDGWLWQSYSGMVARTRDAGDTVWSVQLQGPLVAKPAWIDERVYVVTGGKKVFCLSADSGRVVWEHSSAGGHAAPPAVDERLLYFGSLDSNFYALDAGTGEMRWFFHTNGQIFTAPAIDEAWVYFGSNDGSFYALDKQTGHPQWSVAAGMVLNSSPTVWGDVVIFGASDGRLLFAETTTGAVIREFRTQGSIYSSPIVYDGRVYITDTRRRLYCFGPAAQTSQRTK